MQLGTERTDRASDIVTRSKRVRTKLAGQREQVAKLDALVTPYARYRRLPRGVGVRKVFDHGATKPVFVIEDVVRNAQHASHVPRIVNVLPRTASALLLGGAALVIQLKRHADDIVALALEQRRNNGRIHAARHRRNDAGRARRLVKSKSIDGTAHDAG